MKERPIIFGAPMVCALLDGSKTQTRRVMSRQKRFDFTDYTLFGQRGHPDDKAEGRGGWAEPWVAIEHAPDWPDGKEDQCRCPYASQRGDRLWVRESFARIDGQTRPWIETDYQATYQHGFRLGDSLGIKKRWKSPIFMPRHASRITLEVTGLRVERLQEISPNDCIAEGAWPAEHRELGRGHEAVAAYQQLWEGINGPESWAANPWVWVLDFRRLP